MDHDERSPSDVALDASEIRFRRLFEAAKDGILILDADTGEIAAVNPFLADLLGYSEQEIVGKKLWEIGPLHDIADSKTAFQELQTNEYIRYDDLPLQTRDGRSIAVEFVSNVYPVDGGKVIQCNIRDITARKRMEGQSHLQSEALNAAANAMVITNRDGAIEWVNPAFSTMTGYSAAEAIGRNPRELVKSGQHDRAFYQNLWDTILAGRVWHGDIINRRKDGSLYTEEQTITPVRNAKGTISHFIGVKQDVTERNRRLEALHAAEEHMRFTLEAAGVGTWEIDHATGALHFSNILEAQYGLKPGTFAGTTEAFLALIHAEDREDVRASVANAMREGGDFTLTWRTVWRDGSVHWLRGIGREYLDERGRPLRARGISLDITDRRLLEDQYQQAQKMEAVGRLAGGVAHDFNNLLTAILGYCELLLDEFGPGDGRRKDVEEIQKAGMMAASLTRQLLAFSRKEIIELKVLDLNVVVAEMQAMLRRLIGDDVAVEVGLAREPMLVKADRGQLEQVVLNLGVNARDAMATGGTLTIETAHRALDEHYARTHVGVKPGPYVVLTVTDTGTGMTAEVQARLFEPFFTTKPVGQGTGLGLATIHGIVARMGGSIAVASEVGKGTAFTIYFPMADAAEMAGDEPPPAARSRAGVQTILVVDDASGFRQLAGRMLQRQGYKVLVAANAAEALQVFEQHESIEVLLTDVVMPGGSGAELGRQLVERRPGLKVIYMSGYTAEAIVQHGVIKQGIVFLQKPFTARILAQKIQEVFER